VPIFACILYFSLGGHAENVIRKLRKMTGVIKSLLKICDSKPLPEDEK
jgi:hypothetical protein